MATAPAKSARTILQPGFIGGEISPRLAARIDLAERQRGAAKIENAIVSPAGDLIKRPGTIYAAQTKSNGVAYLFPFVFETGDAYIIELGDLYARFYQTGAIVRDSHNVTGASWAASVATVTMAAHHGQIGDIAVVAGIDPAGYNGTYKITARAAGSISYALADDPGAYVATGTVQDPYEIVSPYAVADIPSIQFDQLGNVIFMAAGPTYARRALTRTSATSWAFTVAESKWGPYAPVNDRSQRTVTPGAATGNNVALTLASAGFAAADLGRQFALANGAVQRWGYGVIDLVTSNVLARMDFTVDIPKTTATEDWRMGVFNDTDGATGDNPRTVTLFQGRLIWGHSVAYPNSIWASTGDDPTDFKDRNPGGAFHDNHGYSFGLAANAQIRLLWMKAASRAMFIGTPTNVIAMSGAGGGALLRSSEEHKTAAAFGSAPVTPVFAGDSLLYVQRSKRRIRALEFSAESDAYTSHDVMLHAEHLSESTLEQVVFAAEPFGVVWVRRADGKLLAATYEKESELRAQKIVAWSRHQIGGSFGTGDAVVESIAVIPSTGRDEVWMVVKRTINSATVRYVEYLAAAHEEWDARAACFYADCAVDYNGAATTAITGLTHLEGQTVDVVVDGNVHPQEVVTGGAITLDYEGSRVIVGLPYQMNVLSNRTASDGIFDNQLNQFGQIHHLTLEFYNTVGIRYFNEETDDSADMNEEDFRDPDTDPEVAIPLFTGPRYLTLAAPWSRESRVYLRHDWPLPCTILGYTMEWAFE